MSWSGPTRQRPPAPPVEQEPGRAELGPVGDELAGRLYDDGVSLYDASAWDVLAVLASPTARPLLLAWLVELGVLPPPPSLEHEAVLEVRDRDAMVVAVGCCCGWSEPLTLPVDPAVAVLAWAEHARTFVR